MLCKENGTDTVRNPVEVCTLVWCSKSLNSMPAYHTAHPSGYNHQKYFPQVPVCTLPRITEDAGHSLAVVCMSSNYHLWLLHLQASDKLERPMGSPPYPRALPINNAICWLALRTDSISSPFSEVSLTSGPSPYFCISQFTIQFISF